MHQDASSLVNTWPLPRCHHLIGAHPPAADSIKMEGILALVTRLYPPESKSCYPLLLSCIHYGLAYLCRSESLCKFYQICIVCDVTSLQSQFTFNKGIMKTSINLHEFDRALMSSTRILHMNSPTILVDILRILLYFISPYIWFGHKQEFYRNSPNIVSHDNF